MIGTTISHYSILDKLGEGGMGMVYKAQDTRLNRKVALKFLPNHMLVNAEAKERFLIEARAAAALNHPNICSIFEIDEYEGTPFLALEFIDGVSLYQRLESGPLELKEALQIVRQIAEGLAEAHDKGIIHRDIKPANIMQTGKGLVKITDFGLAKLQGHTQLTKSGSTMGTVAYMSPEQARSSNVDQRTDIWSLGVVLYQLLCGYLPFQGDCEQVMLYSIINEQPAPITGVPEPLTKPLAIVLSKALAKDLVERYQTMSEFLADIDHLIAGHSAAIKNPHQKSSIFSWPRQHAKYGLLIILMLLAVMIYWFATRSQRSTDTLNPQVIAVMPFSYRGAAEFSYLAEGMVDLLGPRLDGAARMRNVDPRAIFTQVKVHKVQEVDSRTADIIARKFAAGLNVLGAIVEIKGRLRMTASLYETGSPDKPALQLAVDGVSDDFLLMVDQLARQILSELFGKSAQQLESIGAANTRSMAALKAYLEATKAEREGQIEKEYPLLKQAVQEDSTFAMAWYYLSAYALGWIADVQEARFAIAQAQKFSAGLGERYKMYIEGMDRIIKGENLAAAEIHLNLIDKYPDDINGFSQLAGAWSVWSNTFYGRPMSPCLEYFKKWISLDPESGNAYQQMLPVVLWTKNLSEIDAVIAKIKELSPNHEYAWMYIAPRALIAGDKAGLDQALLEAKDKRDLEVRFLSWQFSILAPESDVAVPFLQLLTKPSQPPATRLCGYHSLAYLHSGQGKLDLALAELDSAAAVQPAGGLIFQAYLCSLPFFLTPPAKLEQINHALFQWQADKEKNIIASEFIQSMPVHIYPQTRLYLLGLVQVALGNYEPAARYADQLKRMHTPYDEASIVEQWALTLQALILMHKGNDQQALNLLESRDLRIRFPIFNFTFYSFAFQRYLRGLLLCRLNRPQDALRWFQSIIGLSDYPVIACARLRCAEIYEQMGKKEEAKIYYKQFIAIWQNCDAGLQPQVAEAKTRLEMLK